MREKSREKIQGEERIREEEEECECVWCDGHCCCSSGLFQTLEKDQSVTLFGFLGC